MSDVGKLRSTFAALLHASVFVFGGIAAYAAEPQAGSQTALRFLTMEEGVDDYGAYFSPDGQTVVFARSANDGETSRLFVVAVSGGQARPLLESSMPVSATRANWSARDGSIAFTGTYPGGKSTIWIVGADGAMPRELTLKGVSDEIYYPSWYPDGRRLAFLDSREHVIRRVDRESRRVITLTDPARVLAGMPSVSPDGRWIAFAGQKSTGRPYDQTRNSIWLLHSRGAARPLETESAQGRTPSWSPDGEWLAFESNRGSADPAMHAAFIIKRDGTGVRRITPYEIDANHPVWSRDGQYLAFSARHTPGSERTGIAIARTAPAISGTAARSWVH